MYHGHSLEFELLQDFTWMAHARLQGTLTLTNGTTIDGSFAGQWHKKIEVQKGILEDVEQREERTNKAQAVMAELQ